MIRDEARMWFDLLILIGIVFAIYWLKSQSGIETLDPVDAVQALFGGI